MVRLKVLVSTLVLALAIGAGAAFASVNLLPHPDFQPNGDGMPEGWNIVRGGLGEEIRFRGDAGREGGWVFWFYDVSGNRNRSVGIISDPIDIVPGEEYEASIWIRVNDEGGGRMYLQFFDLNGVRIVSKAINEPQRGHGEWVRIAVKEIAPDEAVQARMMIDSGSSAEARVDLYFEGAQIIRVGGDEIQGDGMEAFSFSVPGASGKLSLLAVNYLENVSGDQLPTSASKCLSAFATPGEYEPLSFVVYAHDELEDVEVFVSDLHLGDHVISESSIEVRLVKWLKRRWGYWVTPTPENLEPDAYFLEVYKPYSMPANHFKQVWLTVHVPEDAPAGEYRGQVTVRSKDGTEAMMPIAFEVLPFALRDSEKLLSIYYRNYGQRTRAQRQRDFESMRAHGLRHVLLRPAIQYRPRVIDGKPSGYWDTSVVESRIRELESYGFEGPHVVISNFDRIPYDDQYKERLFQAEEAIARLEEDLGVEIVLQHMDEVFQVHLRDDYERLTRPAADIDGLKFYMTMYAHDDEASMEWIDPMVDIRSYHGAITDRWLAGGADGTGPLRTFADLADYMNPDGDRLWLYYNVWETEMDPRWMRIINGVYFWQSPYEIHGIWAYSEPSGDLFDDTVGNSGIMGMAFIDPRDGSLLSTRHWEAYREGGDDLRYLATLEQLIEEKRALSHGDAVEAAESFLIELKETWWPDQPLPGRRGYQGAIVRSLNAENPLGALQEMRRQIADHIIALMELD